MNIISTDDHHKPVLVMLYNYGFDIDFNVFRYNFVPNNKPIERHTALCMLRSVEEEKQA